MVLVWECAFSQPPVGICFITPEDAFCNSDETLLKRTESPKKQPNDISLHAHMSYLENNLELCKTSE